MNYKRETLTTAEPSERNVSILRNQISFVNRRQTESKNILNLEEAADFLGMCSKTLAKKAAAGQVPARNVGETSGRHYWRFSRPALEKWLADGATD